FLFLLFNGRSKFLITIRKLTYAFNYTNSICYHYMIYFNHYSLFSLFFIYLFAGFGSEVLLFPVTFKYGLGFNCERYPANFPVVSTSTCKWILYMPFGVFPMVPICCPAFTLSHTFTVFELFSRCIC